MKRFFTLIVLLSSFGLTHSMEDTNQKELTQLKKNSDLNALFNALKEQAQEREKRYYTTSAHASMNTPNAIRQEFAKQDLKKACIGGCTPAAVCCLAGAVTGHIECAYLGVALAVPPLLVITPALRARLDLMAEGIDWKKDVITEEPQKTEKKNL